MERITLLLAFVAVILAAAALYITQQPTTPEETEDEGHELVYQMGHLQRYSAKAAAAGAAANWPLTDFYAHELEETAEEIIAAGYVEDAHDISRLAENWLIPSLSRLEQAIDSEDADAFELAMAGLVESCNACHAATEHPFLKMRVAEEHAFPSQVFDAR